tara:strand:- start:640 stop:777 length:138 start_codon:yes stop_codon:yes gene_type:complete
MYNALKIRKKKKKKTTKKTAKKTAKKPRVPITPFGPFPKPKGPVA